FCEGFTACGLRSEPSLPCSQRSGLAQKAGRGGRDLPQVGADVPGKRAKRQTKVKLWASAIRFEDLDTGIPVVPLGRRDLDVHCGMQQGLTADVGRVREEQDAKGAGGL